jgi:hypothetical protein
LSQVHKTLRLINEISDYSQRSDLRSTLEYTWALLSAWMVALVDRIPSPGTRRVFSPLITIILVVIVIAAGVAIVYFLVVVPSTSSTTSIYP